MKFRILIIIFVFCFSCKKETKIDQENTLPFFNSAVFTPEWIAKDAPEYRKIHTIPDFSFINQNGKIITQDFYKNKIYIADFFFTTCPGICPILTKNMTTIQEKYNSDSEILLLSHTVMPWQDSVPVLKKYALNNNVNDAKWNLVTGNKEEIYNLARNAYFADEDFIKTKDENEFIHTENLVLIDKKGRIRGVYNGTLALEIKRLIRHVNILKLES